MICPPRGLLLAALVCWLALPRAAVVRAQLPPGEELKTLRPAAGIDVALFACEPLITNPAAIDVDTQGRVWVAEIQWYRAGAKTPPADKIKVLEDTDGDGRADKVTVFADGVFAPMSICVAGDKVYVATSPDLWVYEDKDGDLKADGPPHKAAHRLWRPQPRPRRPQPGAGARPQVVDVARRRRLRRARAPTARTSSTNGAPCCAASWTAASWKPWPSTFAIPTRSASARSAKPFLSDNDNDGNESVRICWIMEGGNYGWFGGPPFGKQELDARLSPDTPFREHWHFRGHVPGFVPATLVTGFGSPMRHLLSTRGTPSGRNTRTRRCTPTPARASAASIATNWPASA